MLSWAEAPELWRTLQKVYTKCVMFKNKAERLLQPELLTMHDEASCLHVICTWVHPAS